MAESSDSDEDIDITMDLHSVIQSRTTNDRKPLLPHTSAMAIPSMTSHRAAPLRHTTRKVLINHQEKWQEI